MQLKSLCLILLLPMTGCDYIAEHQNLQKQHLKLEERKIALEELKETRARRTQALEEGHATATANAGKSISVGDLYEWIDMFDRILKGEMFASVTHKGKKVFHMAGEPKNFNLDEAEEENQKKQRADEVAKALLSPKS